MSAAILSAATVADAIVRLRERAARVHSLTNSVAETFTANVLLAAGAIPSMTINRDEVPHFVAGADALLVNVGTMYPRFTEAAEIGVEAARRHRKPWAFDPVFVDRSPPRLAFAKSLLAQGPAIVRANGQELAALSGADGGDEAAERFAAEHGFVVARTGPVDLVTDGTRSVRVANGHPYMAKVTAVGCAVTALMAGFAAVGQDRLLAAASCLVTAGIAGEMAAEKAQGPGSFVPAFLDALYLIGPADIAARMRLS